MLRTLQFSPLTGQILVLTVEEALRGRLPSGSRLEEPLAKSCSEEHTDQQGGREND
jgi:hypothetical protein